MTIEFVKNSLFFNRENWNSLNIPVKMEVMQFSNLIGILDEINDSDGLFLGYKIEVVKTRWPLKKFYNNMNEFKKECEEFIVD